MRTLQVLGALYLSIYAIVGGALVLGGAPDVLAWLWFPYGLTLLVFHLSTPRESFWKRATCGLIVGAISGSVVLSAMLAVVEVAEEAALLSSGVAIGAAWLLVGGTTLMVLVLMSAWTATRLRPPRRARGLIELAAAPSILVVACAALAGIVMLLRPERPELFLDGLMAIISLSWCGLAATWLAGAWLSVLRARALLDPPPLPIARLT